MIDRGTPLQQYREKLDWGGDEAIAAAAILFRGVVCVLPPPARHHTILHAIHALHPGEVIGPDEQGFVTNFGRFVERAEARDIAVLAGQTDTVHSHLFSEDLW